MNQKSEPDRDCSRCARLKAFRLVQKEAFPNWHNAPVETWSADAGDSTVQLLIVGLAPGLQGAHRTGRPFTGDYAGDLLYQTLSEHRFTSGTYGREPTDGLKLVGSAITNAVRCVPPQNKPIAEEINSCRPFLSATLGRFENLKAVVCLGKIAHDSVVRTLGEKPSGFKFTHGADYKVCEYRLFSSYHCSRYNTNTGRLTPAMFSSVFENVREFLSA